MLKNKKLFPVLLTVLIISSCAIAATDNIWRNFIRANILYLAQNISTPAPATTIQAYIKDHTSCDTLFTQFGSDAGITIGENGHSLVADPSNYNATEQYGVIDCSNYSVIITSGIIVTVKNYRTADNLNGYGVVLKAKELTINGKLLADGLGYPATFGPGKGINNAAGSGGAHGGDGGQNSYGNLGGKSAGSAAKPTTLGSGGGNGYNGVGGAGGGAIKLDVIGNLTINGTITANGLNGSTATSGYRDGGGGAGGSIYIITKAVLAGSGSITANGGNTTIADCCNGPGAGGGGRIAIYYEDYDLTINSLHKNSSANGGDGWRTYDGQAGTVGYFDQNNGTLSPSLSIFQSYEFVTTDSENGAFNLNSLNVDGFSRSNGGEIRIEKNTSVPNTLNIAQSLNFKDSTLIVEGNSIFNILGNADFSQSSKETKIYGLNNGEEIKLNFTVTGTMNIGTNVAINLDGDGFGPTKGDGAGINNAAGSGGAHGGDGNQTTYGNLGGKSYGSAAKPTTLGSGGGNGYNGIGGAGGGALSLDVIGNLTINGNISSNGLAGSTATSGYRDGGGGAGGSIYISTKATLAGTGAIIANGGNTQTADCCQGPGAGGGGRIAVYFEDYDFTNNALHKNSTANGGDGWRSYDGQGGTVGFFDFNSHTLPLSLYVFQSYEFITTDSENGIFNLNSLTIDGGPRALGGEIRIEKNTTAPNTINIAQNLSLKDSNVILEGSTIFNIKNDLEINKINRDTNIYGLNNGQEITLTINSGTDVTTNKAIIGEGVKINLDGDGYNSVAGVQPGISNTAGSGGAHGGNGNQNTYGNIGGKSYGSSAKPTTLGSGGGNGGSGVGGAGGGAFKMDVNANLTINGIISSNGLNGSALTAGYRDGGGGAGGSVYIITKGKLTGNGSVLSNGGGTQTGDCCNGPGGGGGGRIAIYFEDYDFNTNTLHKNSTANGGDGWKTNDGQIGTVGLFDINQTPDITSDDDLYSYKSFEFVTADALENNWTYNNISFQQANIRNQTDPQPKTLKIKGNLQLVDSTFELGVSTTFDVMGNFDLNHNSSSSNIFGSGNGQQIKANFIVLGNMSVSSASQVNLTGDGYPSATGESAGINGVAGSGAAHGGDGNANTYGNLGGKSYGSAIAPVTFGSGGGNGGSGVGGAGGGIITLDITGNLTINGVIASNGLNGSTATAGYRDGAGGAGGSIYIKTKNNLDGTGSITANGGGAQLNDCCNGPSGGGGGRIAVYYKNYNPSTSTIHLKSTSLGGDGWRTLDGQDGTVGYFGLNDSANPDLNVYTTYEFTNNDAINQSWTYRNINFSGAKIRLETDSNTKTIACLGDFMMTNSTFDLETSTIMEVTGNINLLSSGNETVIRGENIGRKIILDIRSGKTMTVAAGASINLEGDGNPAATGEGAGSSGVAGAGGGYGGTGGNSSYRNLGGKPYGSMNIPANLGSGGGNGYNGHGGAGGGYIKISVVDSLKLDGTLNVNGQNGSAKTSGYRDGGGGSGGSVHISVNNGLSGNGKILAQGGSTQTSDCCNGPGGGGGGRIALYYFYYNKSSSSILNNLNINSGNGWRSSTNGSAGTVYYTLSDITQPNINTPDSTTRNVSLSPRFIGNKFNGSGEHLSSDWKIIATNNCENDLGVWTSENNTTALTEITINTGSGKFMSDLTGKTNLFYNTTYYVCLRHRSKSSASPWSVPFQFITEPDYSTAKIFAWNFKNPTKYLTVLNKTVVKNDVGQLVRQADNNYPVGITEIAITAAQGVKVNTAFGFNHIYGPDNGGTVNYQLSCDNIKWYYHPGGSNKWTVVPNPFDLSHTAPVNIMNSYIRDFLVDLNNICPEGLRFKAFFISQNNSPVSLDEIDIKHFDSTLIPVEDIPLAENIEEKTPSTPVAPGDQTKTPVPATSEPDQTSNKTSLDDVKNTTSTTKTTETTTAAEKNIVTDKAEIANQFGQKFEEAANTISSRQKDLQIKKENLEQMSQDRLAQIQEAKKEIASQIVVGGGEKTIEQIQQKQEQIAKQNQKISIKEDIRTVNQSAIVDTSPMVIEKINKLSNEQNINIMISFDESNISQSKIELLNKLGKVEQQIDNTVALSISPEQAKFLLETSKTLGIKKVEENFDLFLTLDTATHKIGSSLVIDDLGYSGKNITVAVLDTGIDSSHPGLKNQVIDAVDFTNEGVGDHNGHGTHISCIIACNHKVYRGNAPGVKLIDIKIIKNDGSGKLSSALAGIKYAIDKKVNVINFSSGAKINKCDGSDILSQAIDKAVAQGITIVTSAGNNGSSENTITTPGCSKGAITVGSVNRSNEVNDFSSRGPTSDGRLKPEILAPGTDITAAWLNHSFSTLSGTSQATPFVTGAVALLLESNKNLTPIDIKYVFTETATPLKKKLAKNDTTGVLNTYDAIYLYQGLDISKKYAGKHPDKKLSIIDQPKIDLQEIFNEQVKIAREDLKNCVYRNKNSVEGRKICNNDYLKNQVKLQRQRLSLDEQKKLAEVQKKAAMLYKFSYPSDPNLEKKIHNLGAVIYYTILPEKETEETLLSINTFLNKDTNTPEFIYDTTTLIKDFLKQREKANNAKYERGLIPFRDIDDSKWPFAFVKELKEKGCVSGFKSENGEDTGEFRPNNNVSIAESLRIILECSGYDQNKNMELTNKSLSNHWAKGYFAKADELNLSLVKNTKIDPNTKVTRLEAVKLILQAFNVPLITNYQHIFTDVEKGTEDANYIHTAYLLGIISGDADSTTFRPNDPLNRAEIAKITIESSELFKPVLLK